MSFLIDFAEFLNDYNITIETGSYPNGRYSKSTTTDTIKAIVQPYSETSLNDNPIQRKRGMNGKDLRGVIAIQTDSNLDLNGNTKVYIENEGQLFEIEQKMSYNKVYEHYEYLACIVKSDGN